MVENLEKYLPVDATEIVSGGAKGIDTCAKEYALRSKIKLTEFLPQYNIYGRSAPLKRNLEIINYSDLVIAFWDKKSAVTLLEASLQIIINVLSLKRLSLACTAENCVNLVLNHALDSITCGSKVLSGVKV